MTLHAYELTRSVHAKHARSRPCAVEDFSGNRFWRFTEAAMAAPLLAALRRGCGGRLQPMRTGDAVSKAWSGSQRHLESAAPVARILDGKALAADIRLVRTRPHAHPRS